LWTAAIFSSLARLANDGATFSTYTCAGNVKRALKEAGFGWKRAMLAGRLASR
jgi:tRNA 5-methylaminomethyl-2-thiouridine biosynthesis bifunctional protein